MHLPTPPSSHNLCYDDSGYVTSKASLEVRNFLTATELIRDFVNTRDLLDEKEELGSPESLTAWLDGHGVDARRGSGDAVRTCAGRSSCARRSGSSCSSTPASRSTGTRPPECSTERRAAARIELCFEQCSGALTPAATGVDAALGRLVIARPPRHGRRLMGTAEGLPGLGLRVGVHRQRPQPLPRLVLDEVVRQPREGPRLPRAAPALRLATRHGDVRVRGEALNWSYPHCVTFGPTMWATFCKRYGTHGTTFVISLRSSALVAGETRLAGQRAAAVELRSRRSGRRGCCPSARATSPARAGGRRASSSCSPAG